MRPKRSMSEDRNLIRKGVASLTAFAAFSMAGGHVIDVNLLAEVLGSGQFATVAYTIVGVLGLFELGEESGINARLQTK